MDTQTDILRRGLDAAWQAVLGASAIADLHLGPRQITRSAARRISGRLRQIETIVRRLILVLALQVRLKPASPRPAGPVTHPDTAAAPDDITVAGFPRLSRRRLKLLPARRRFEAAPEFPAPGLRPAGPVSPLKLMARIAALHTVISDPDAHALRLARSLRRMRKSGEPRPVIAPAESAYRLSPELGAIATLLPTQIHAAFDTWERSG